MFFLIPGFISAQNDEYKLDFAPDAWYNEVDGVRLGVRVLGEMEGTFLDGPHRLDAGAWLSTWFPDLPASYYGSFTEPIPAISSYANEGNISLMSSIRTGYSQHGVSFNKRWQPGFNEFRFKELSVSFNQEKLIDSEYRPYPQLWQTEWKSLISIDFWWSDARNFNSFDFKVSLSQNINSGSGSFTTGTVEITDQLKLSDLFKLRIRGFGGYASNGTAPEYLFGYSYRQPINWLNNGVTRAKGTLPGNLLDDGLFNISGGANLRGYTQHDFTALQNGDIALYQSIAALNTEFEFPNFVNSNLNKTMAGDFVHIRTYLFFDIGKTLEEDISTIPGSTVEPPLLADAGAGLQFSLNIPDFLGKDRGFALRYEVPFWLSDPLGNDNNFKFRNLIGIGAVISL